MDPEDYERNIFYCPLLNLWKRFYTVYGECTVDLSNVKDVVGEL